MPLASECAEEFGAARTVVIVAEVDQFLLDGVLQLLE